MTDVKTLAIPWTKNSFKLSTQLISSCSNLLAYLGGPNLQYSSGYMERLYTGFTIHDIIYYHITVILCGVWQPADTFTIQFDDGEKFIFDSIYMIPSAQFTITCGASNVPCLNQNIVGKFLHTKSTVTLRVSWNFKGNGLPAPAIGIKDVSFAFGTRKTGDVQEAYLSLGDPAKPWSTRCPQSSYYDERLKKCYGCDGSCLLCYGPANTECYGPQYQSFYNGKIYMFCSPPCLQCWGTANNQCYRCSLLDYDNTCQSSCTTPYVSFGSSYKICLKPCAANEYMLWNNTCGSSCNFPLISGTTTHGNTCDYPCGLSSSVFLYWNGSCLPTCPYNIRVENYYQFCDVCPQNQYTYPNGLCLSACYAHFHLSVNGGASFCSYPCATGHFLYQDGSCHPDCGWAYKKRTKHGFSFCDHCTESDRTCLMPAELSQAQTISATYSGFRSAVSVCTGIVSLLTYTNPSAFLFFIITDLLSYLRYLKINYPPKLQYFLDTGRDIFIELLPGIPENLASHFRNQTLPINFQRGELSSSYIVNFWKTGIIFLTVLVLALISSLLEICSKRFYWSNPLCRKVKKIFIWNFSFMVLLSSFDEIIFYSSFELRALHLIDAYSVASCIICLLMNLVMLLGFIKVFHIILQLKSNANLPIIISGPDGHRLASPKDNQKQFEILYESFKQNTIAQQYFILIFIAKVTAFLLIISYLFNYPLFQAVLITLLNISSLIYIAIVRPQKSRRDFIKSIIDEILVLIISVCLLALGIMDSRKTQSIKARNTIGDIFVFTNISFTAAGALYLAIKSIIGVVYTIKALKDWYKRDERATIRSENEIRVNQVAPQGIKGREESSQIVLTDVTMVSNRLQSHGPVLLTNSNCFSGVQEQDISNLNISGLHQPSIRGGQNERNSQAPLNESSPNAIRKRKIKRH